MTTYLCALPCGAHLDVRGIFCAYQLAPFSSVLHLRVTRVTLPCLEQLQQLASYMHGMLRIYVTKICIYSS